MTSGLPEPRFPQDSHLSLDPRGDTIYRSQVEERAREPTCTSAPVTQPHVDLRSEPFGCDGEMLI